MLQGNNPGGTYFNLRGGSDSDTLLLRVSAAGLNENISSNLSADYGFNIRYRGDLSGIENALQIDADNQDGTAIEALRIKQDGVTYFGPTPYVGSNVIWHAGNDGPESGLNADLLDGEQGTYYLNTSSTEQTKIGRLAIGSSNFSSSVATLHVFGASPTTLYEGQISLETTDTTGAVNTGSAIVLNGHDGFSPRTLATIRGLKENGTSGNHAGYLALSTRINNGLPTEKLRITSVGNVGIGTTNPGYKLEVVGSFAATTKSFIIPHPTKKGYKLRYGSLEGPENGIYVRGKSNGSVIELPEYWVKLVDKDSITVSLTPFGKPGSIWVERIEGNKIYVGREADSLEYFYMVLAERADVDKLEVEVPEVNP